MGGMIRILWRRNQLRANIYMLSGNVFPDFLTPTGRGLSVGPLGTNDLQWLINRDALSLL